MILINADALLKRLERFCEWCQDKRLSGAQFAIWLIKDEIRKDVLSTFGVDLLEEERKKGAKFTDNEENDGGAENEY